MLPVTIRKKQSLTWLSPSPRSPSTLTAPAPDGTQLVDTVGTREWEKDVYQALADKLEEYDRPKWALETLLEIQKRWPLDPDNPDRQQKVAWLYKNKLPEEGASAPARALADLADNYGEDTEWWTPIVPTRTRSPRLGATSRIHCSGGARAP